MWPADHKLHLLETTIYRSPQDGIYQDGDERRRLLINLPDKMHDHIRNLKRLLTTHRKLHEQGDTTGMPDADKKELRSKTLEISEFINPSRHLNDEKRGLLGWILEVNFYGMWKHMYLDNDYYDKNDGNPRLKHSDVFEWLRKHSTKILNKEDFLCPCV